LYRKFAKELITMCGFILELLAPPQISMVTMILLKQTNKQSIKLLFTFRIESIHHRLIYQLL
jgi:hypothetical protein